MESNYRKVMVNEHSMLALPRILECAAKSKIYENNNDIFNCLMTAAFNKMMLPEDKLDGVDDDDARFAKAMLKITAFSILELLDDFDATPVINMMEQIKHEND